MSSILPGGARFPNDPAGGKEAGYGLPSWAKRDHGPMNTYVPGPLSTEPLQSSYHGNVRLIVSAALFAVIIVFVLLTSQSGVLGSVLILVALWALYAVPVWFRTRIGFRVDGSRAEVHGLFSGVSFDGADVEKVQYVFNGRSPDIRLVLRDGRKVMVVASRLEKGHSTLYEWLRRYAPDAEYDKKALDLRDTLVNRGLTGAPGDPWDEAGRYGPPPVAGKPADEAPPSPLPHEPVGDVHRRHEGPPPTPPFAAAPSPKGTTSYSAPSETVKTSPPPEATAPDSAETRTDDDEQA